MKGVIADVEHRKAFERAGLDRSDGGDDDFLLCGGFGDDDVQVEDLVAHQEGISPLEHQLALRRAWALDRE